MYQSPIGSRRVSTRSRYFRFQIVAIVAAIGLWLVWSLRVDPQAAAETRNAVIAAYTEEQHDLRPINQRPSLEQQYGRLLQWRIIRGRHVPFFPRRWVYDVVAVRQSLQTMHLMRSQETVMTLAAGGNNLWYPASVIDIDVESETPMDGTTDQHAAP